jgi:hypothetical protein
MLIAEDRKYDAGFVHTENDDDAYWALNLKVLYDTDNQIQYLKSSAVCYILMDRSSNDGYQNLLST